jgi:hypothetical protein
MDSPLTPEQLILIKGLSEDQLDSIDKALLASACEHWRKVSRIVSMTMGALPNNVNGIPDVFYSKRVALLVQKGKLLSQGDLNCMRYSEIKLP